MSTDSLLRSARDVGRRWWGGLLDLLYPPRCVGCGSLGAWFCAACVERITFLCPPLCPHCGEPSPGGQPCAPCGRAPAYLTGMRSVGYHLPPLQQAVIVLKHENVRVLATPLGDLMADYWRAHPLPVDLIVPVPLHEARLRQRGYNQSLLLARTLGQRIGLPVQPDVLRRARNTPSQVGLSAKERHANVADAFSCPQGALRGAHVVLLDDVLTTGATTESCARVLLEAGVADVWAFTLTRAVRGNLVAPGRALR